MRVAKNEHPTELGVVSAIAHRLRQLPPRQPSSGLHATGGSKASPAPLHTLYASSPAHSLAPG